jgi:hypothetical protein
MDTNHPLLLDAHLNPVAIRVSAFRSQTNILHIHFCDLENPAEFDDMLDTVLGLRKKGVATLPQTHPTVPSQSRDKPTPFTSATNPANSGGVQKVERDVGKRLFESGTYKDPRLVYDVR